MRESLFQDSFSSGHHSSVVSSAPTILRPRVRIPSTPSMLFSICIEIVTRKRTKINKRGRDWPIFKRFLFLFWMFSEKTVSLVCTLPSYISVFSYIFSILNILILTSRVYYLSHFILISWLKNAISGYVVNLFLIQSEFHMSFVSTWARCGSQPTLSIFLISFSQTIHILSCSVLV